MKTCIRCAKSKALNEFYLRPDNPNKHNNKCINCVKLESAKHARDFPERKKIRDKKWREDNKAHLNEYARIRYHENPEPKKQYAKNNRNKINARTRHKRATDPQYKIGMNLRRNPRTGEMMTWDNHSTHGGHVDHIHQLASFDMTDPIQFQQACHYNNLQPLWAEENLSKNKSRLAFRPKT